MNSSITLEREGITRPWRDRKKIERLWHKKTGGHSNIQNGRDGKIESNGTTISSNEDPGTTPPTTNITETTTAVNNNNRVKWVHYLSKTPLTEAYEKALAHGPNFAIVTKEPLVSEYISQIERVCQQLKQGKVEELRGETKQIFKNIQDPKPNITEKEAKAIQDLKRDKERVILTANKWVSMVVMDKEDYIKNQKSSYTNQPTKNLHQTPPPNIRT